jgi:hypothetical protein
MGATPGLYTFLKREADSGKGGGSDAEDGSDG